MLLCNFCSVLKVVVLQKPITKSDTDRKMWCPSLWEETIFGMAFIHHIQTPLIAEALKKPENAIFQGSKRALNCFFWNKSVESPR